MSRKKHLKAEDGGWLDHRERLYQETIFPEKKGKADQIAKAKNTSFKRANDMGICSHQGC
jgi:hypothetical protein